jgi:hypothetical protein
MVPLQSDVLPLHYGELERHMKDMDCGFCMKERCFRDIICLNVVNLVCSFFYQLTKDCSAAKKELNDEPFEGLPRSARHDPATSLGTQTITTSRKESALAKN